jgi:hypothetical protein
MALTKVIPQMLGNGSFTVTSSTTASALGYEVIYIALGDLITVNAGVVFTIDVPFEAGFYQCFSGPGIVQGLRFAHFEWFGAKGDAVSPSVPVLGINLLTFDPVTDIPTGTDDSAAIRKTMLSVYSPEMMSNYLDPLSGSPPWGPNIGPGSQPFYPSKRLAGYQAIIQGRPGAAYLCSGTNLLGLQTTVNQKIFFDGQGCSFEWLPQNDFDYFIDKLDLVDRPVYQNFTLRTWGFAGNRGVFCHAGTAATGGNPSGVNKQFSNLLKGALFHNVYVDRGGYYHLTTDPLNVFVAGPTTGNALKVVFFIESNNLCDTWEISHSLFCGYSSFLVCRNPEAVAFSIHDTEIQSYYPNIVHLLFENQYSGGFWMNNCQIGLWGDNQTLLQTTTTSAVPVTSQPLVIRDCRIETRFDNFKLFDLQFGDLYVENVNPDNGNPAGTANAVSVIVKKYTKKVTVVNSFLPQTLTMYAYTAAEYAALGGANFDITFDGCTFPFGTPLINWRKESDDSSIEIPTVFRNFLRTRLFSNLNCNNGLNWANGTPVSEVNFAPTFFLAFNTYSQTDGNTYINTNLGMPVGILITSMVVVANASNLALTDRILIEFPNSSLALTAMLSATLVTKTELIPASQKGICVLTSQSGYNGMLGSYYLGAALSATKVPATVEIRYRPIYSLSEVNPVDNKTALV